MPPAGRTESVAATGAAGSSGTVHGPLRHAGMANITVPDPVGVALEFGSNRCVGIVCRCIFSMRAVMASLAVDPVVHVARRAVLEHGIPVKGSSILRMQCIMAAAALWLIDPWLSAALE